VLSPTWTPAAVSSKALAWNGRVWRVVEAQHIASTMKIVDSVDEQSVLEQLLESSKPKQPDGLSHLDYLLATPFRYAPHRGGSRFRHETDEGVFYAASELRTACAELGFWRWRFLQHSTDLRELDPVAHTAFQSIIDTTVVDVRNAPFTRYRERWTHPIDYSFCQAFARTVRRAKVVALLYESVRDPEKGQCVALFTPAGFARPKPVASQTWFLRVTRRSVAWSDGAGQRLEFEFDV